MVRRRELSWGLPGGYAGRDESARAAALRECWEETGVDLHDEAVRRSLGGFGLTDMVAPISLSDRFRPICMNGAVIPRMGI